MKTRELAEALVDSRAWDGSSDVIYLEKNYTRDELQDAYDMLDEAEQDYDEGEVI